MCDGEISAGDCLGSGRLLPERRCGELSIIELDGLRFIDDVEVVTVARAASTTDGSFNPRSYWR